MRPYKPGLTITYEEVHRLTDLSLNALHQAGGRAQPGRQPLDLNSLESVVLWLAGHARQDLRVKICALSAQALLGGTLGAGDRGGAPRRPRKKRQA
jgi:hypothetical protein